MHFNKRLNPLTILILVLIYIALVFKASHIIQFLFLMAIFPPFFFSKNILRSVIFRIKPFLLFLPLMFGVYIGISLILSNQPFNEIVISTGLSGLRLFLMILSMALFLGLGNLTSLIDSLRTLWSKTGIKWRVIEDGFQLLYLTFRFFPTCQDDIRNYGNFEKALGFPSDNGRWGSVKRYATKLPALIAVSFRRAEQLGWAMEVRDYGRIIPRGIASPVPFTVIDGMALTIALLCIIGFKSLA